MLPKRLIFPAVLAIGLSFAAGVMSAAVLPARSIEAAHAERLAADLMRAEPFDYFPGRYRNEATEIEPLPPQF